MSDKESRKATINGNQYHVTIEMGSRFKRVSIYGPDVDKFSRHKDSTDLVYDKRWRGRFLWLGKDTTPPIAEMVQEATNKAVCIYEDKIEEEEEHNRRIRQALDTVAETHES